MVYTLHFSHRVEAPHQVNRHFVPSLSSPDEGEQETVQPGDEKSRPGFWVWVARDRLVPAIRPPENP